MPGWTAGDVPVDEIIRKFAAKEAEFAQARSNYTYRQSVKMEELDPSGNPGIYFELRVDARPVDPLQWLTKR
jgi:hypothetical protein